MVRVLAFLIVFAATPALAQNFGSGFLRFSGPLESVLELDKRVNLVVTVHGARMSVEADEHTTVTGSLGGRISARALVPGLFLEIQGWVGSNGSLRATEIQIKVQSGAMRMTGRIENIVAKSESTSMLVQGAEFQLDTRTAVVAQKGGLGVSGTISDLKIGDEVDVTGTYLNDGGSGPATSGLFHADRVIVSRTFRIQGVIRSRTPAVGNPTVLVVHGIVVTLTPETTIASNGMNERNESFMPRAPSVISPIEDDAGNPCLNFPAGTDGCPDVPPKDPAAAGELQLGAFVRIEGILEDTGFSSRYTARAVQVEKPNQVRFQAVVESRDNRVLTVRLGGLRAQVLLDGETQMEGDIAAGRFVEIAAQFNAELAIVARRIKVLQ